MDLGKPWVMRVGKDGKKVLQKSVPPEILFIQRCVQFLKPGTGRMAMVIPNGILNNPALGYVRQWMLENTQILAVVDMARDLFQPKNDTQTSMVLLRRLSQDEARVARARGLDYPVFMSITDKIGHDKRGNTIFRRTPDGHEVLVARKELVTEIHRKTGNEVVRETEIKEKVVDDELPEVAESYAKWLEEQQ